MKIFFRDVLIFVIVLILTYFSSILFVLVYSKVNPDSMGGGWIPGEAVYFIVSLIPIFLFFTSFLFTIFGKKEKYWIIGIISTSVIIRIYYTGFIEVVGIYLPITFGVLGLLFGLGVSKFLAKPVRVRHGSGTPRGKDYY